jgi:hypothetical protein
MARVCLILPIASASSLSVEGVARCREGLESAGHSVEVLAVHDGREPSPADPVNGSWTWHPADSDGLSAAAITGLWKADAVDGVECLIILDPTRGYRVEDLARMLEPLVDGSADLVVARRQEAPGTLARAGLTAHGYRLASGLAGRITRPLLGASDVFVQPGRLAVHDRPAVPLQGPEDRSAGPRRGSRLPAGYPV